MGLLVAVIGGLLIYDGFAGRSLWGDFLTVLRGQALTKANPSNQPNFSNPNADSNPLNAPVGSDAQGGNAPNVPSNPIPPVAPSVSSNNPIGRIRGAI